MLTRRTHLPLPCCSSRLASRIVLDQSMSGMAVALGKHYPWRSL